MDTIEKTFCLEMESLYTLMEHKPPRLYCVSPSKFHNFFRNFQKNDFQKVCTQLKKRLAHKKYGRILSSLHVMLYYSIRLFPGFSCMLSEFMNEEWLSLIDFHKDFHRDHIVHQTQVALVLKWLFNEMIFEPNGNELMNEFNEFVEAFSNLDKDDKKLSLLNLTAYMLASQRSSLNYLFCFAESLGISQKDLGIKSKPSIRAFKFWRKIAYHAGITAALFHDIGYPFQFVGTVEKALRQSGFIEFLGNMDIHKINRYFANHLCISPFKAYTWGNTYPFPHNYYDQYVDAMKEALQKTHGLPGALAFLYINNEMREWETGKENPVGILIMELAALAIVMHDMQKIYCPADSPKRNFMRVSFLRDPISFLLTLADNIQSYGRMNATFSKQDNINTDSVLMNTYSAISKTKLIWEPKYLNLEIRYQIPKDHIKTYYTHKTKFCDEQQKDFFDPLYGYLDYQGLFNKITVGADLC